MDLDITDEAFVSGSESEVSEANYSSSSIALSDLSSGSEKSEERSMSDKSVQTDLEVEPLWRTRYPSTCVNVNLAYQDRVSLWVDGRSPDDDNVGPETPNKENKNFVVIAGKEKVTLRINPGRQERRLSDATLYEDIEEASEWLSEEYLQSLQSPPPLPPRVLPARSENIKRKNLNHLLGIDQQMDLNILRRNNANINAVNNLEEKGRVRNKKDLTKFLGINDVKLRKKPMNKNNANHHRRSKSIIENIFQATRQRKSVRNSLLDQTVFMDDSFSQFSGDQDQGRWEKINPEKHPDESRRDVTGIEDSDHLKTSLKIVSGNENDEKEVSNKDLAYDKFRTSSFSSVSSTRSSSKESLTEKSAISRIFHNSSRRFSTSGIELMQSLRLKSNYEGKFQQSSLNDLSGESSSTSEAPYSDRSYIEDFIARGMPVIPFDQPLMALMDSKQEKVVETIAKKNLERREEDYTSVSDSLDTLIKLARQQLTNSSNEEPIYIEMTKATSSLNKHSVINNNNKPKHNEYMDMDVVQSALSNFKFN